jgi:hypothetical protein
MAHAVEIALLNNLEIYDDGSWEPKHVVKENKYDTKANIVLIVS